MFLQQLITGLSVGSIYALMAVGYSLIYSLLNFTNFAHGASVLIGAYVGYFYISSVADNVLMAVVCSTFFGAVLAALIERIAYQPLLNKGVKRIYLLIAGLGISIIGENLIVVMIPRLQNLLVCYASFYFGRKYRSGRFDNSCCQRDSFAERSVLDSQDSRRSCNTRRGIRFDNCVYYGNQCAAIDFNCIYHRWFHGRPFRCISWHQIYSLSYNGKLDEQSVY